MTRAAERLFDDFCKTLEEETHYMGLHSSGGDVVAAKLHVSDTGDLKVQPVTKGEMYKDPDSDDRECSICEGPFNIDTEGGAEGFIGIIPVAFCPTCKVGIFDFVEQGCPRCQGAEDDDF